MDWVSVMNRRTFLAATGTGVVLMGQAPNDLWAATPEDEAQEKAVTPAEDLMFEHGVIERVLLIYEKLCESIEAGKPAPASVLLEAATLMRHFVEDYHEKLEEQHVFPALERARQDTVLVQALRNQHIAGREITGLLLELTTADSLAEPKRAAQAMRAFCRMYWPHIAYENSVAFRAFHDLLPDDLYRELGERFEEIEHDRVGEEGFEKAVERVADMEKRLEIHDLNLYTAKMGM